VANHISDPQDFISHSTQAISATISEFSDKRRVKSHGHAENLNESHSRTFPNHRAQACEPNSGKHLNNE
jgi:hypothetical protein